jgi:hypothetical protein
MRRAVRALRADGAAPRGPASLVVGRVGPGLFGSMAGPQQAERALCMWPRLGFGPVVGLN